MQESICSNNQFKETYLDVLKARLTLASLEVESENKELTSAIQTIRMMGLNNALKLCLDNKDEFYERYEFLNYTQQIVKMITCGENEKFRTSNVTVIGSKIRRAEPYNIRQELLNIIDNYNYQKAMYLDKIKNQSLIDYVAAEDELFYIESQFHIEFLKIHPFEDGNGRTARVILAANLLNNNHAPCIVTKKTKEKYCSYIENNDIVGMAIFLKELSLQEKSNIESIYSNLAENNMTLKLKKTE